MAYVDFPDNLKGQKERKAFWLSKDGLTLIAGWRRQGVPLTEIADKYVGVSRTAFFGWYRQSDELRKACSVSLEAANMSVEESLLKRATGYYYEEESYELIEGKLVLTKKYKRYLPPDTKAILSWLYNRMPQRWRAVQESVDSTQYTEAVKQIVVAMKQVAETGHQVSTKETDHNADKV